MSACIVAASLFATKLFSLLSFSHFIHCSICTRCAPRLLVLLAALCACVAAKTITVEFGPLLRFPAVVRGNPGDCVVWKISGEGVHQIVWPAGDFESSGFLYPGEEYKQCFSLDGVYTYYDGINPSIRSLVVIGKFSGAAPVAF